jgi:hypothetical protein
MRPPGGNIAGGDRGRKGPCRAFGEEEQTIADWALKIRKERKRYKLDSRNPLVEGGVQMAKDGPKMSKNMPVGVRRGPERAMARLFLPFFAARPTSPRLGTAIASVVFVIRRKPTRPTRRFGADPGNGEVEAL